MTRTNPLFAQPKRLVSTPPRASLNRLMRGAALIAVSVMMVSCGGGGGGGGGGGDIDPPSGTTPPPPPPPPPPTPDPDPAQPSSSDSSKAFETAQSTSRFLTQTTFGAKPADVQRLTGTSPSAWIQAEFNKPVSLFSPYLDGYIRTYTDDSFIPNQTPSFAAWRNFIGGDDQLRQRMVFALSQILVVSDAGGEFLADYPKALLAYQDILANHAFGNYRDLIEEVTYSPTMGYFLTFIGNQKADPSTGRMPDENYARELLQLFTTGLVQLNSDGTPVMGGNGQPIELFDNSDITNLARVFTGLDLAGLDRNQFPILIEADLDSDTLSGSFAKRMVINESVHSEQRKQFLNCDISAGTPAAASISQALDCIMAHPNIGPFVGRQLIQRFTTSNPDPDYVQRVATAFDTGAFTLPDGTTVGDGRKGDLKATLSAVLFDPDVRSASAQSDVGFGKVREPVLRFTQWARAFNVNADYPEYLPDLYEMHSPALLNQHPFRSRSVFNFYRPGFVAPGTESGALNMTVPELQIVNANSNTGYINTMAFFAFGGSNGEIDEDYAQEILEESGVRLDPAIAATAYVPDYADVRPRVADSQGLIDYLDALLLYSSMSAETKTSIVSTLDQIPFNESDEDSAIERIGFAILLVMTSPDYLVQR